MYGLLALGFHVTYAVSGTVNFSQGSSMMLGAVLGYTSCSCSGLACRSPACRWCSSLCALYGLVVERFAVRPFARRGSNAWLMATVALGIVVDNMVLFTFGKEPRGFPSPARGASRSSSPSGAGVYPLQLVIPVVGLALAAALHLFLRRTRYGKAMLAVVQNADAARLMGINVPRAIAGGYALSAVFAGVAGHHDRAAVQRHLRHGHAVRPQGVRGRDPRRPRAAPGA